jgi:hypothetical protein
MSSDRESFEKASGSTPLSDLPAQPLTAEQADGVRGGLDAVSADGAVDGLATDADTAAAREAATGQATGRRTYKPIR